MFAVIAELYETVLDAGDERVMLEAARMASFRLEPASGAQRRSKIGSDVPAVDAGAGCLHFVHALLSFLRSELSNSTRMTRRP